MTSPEPDSAQVEVVYVQKPRRFVVQEKSYSFHAQFWRNIRNFDTLEAAVDYVDMVYYTFHDEGEQVRVIDTSPSRNQTHSTREVGEN